MEWRKEGGLVSDVVESCYLNVRIWKFGLPIVVYSRRRRVRGEVVRGIEKKTGRQRRRRKTAAFGKVSPGGRKRRGKHAKRKKNEICAPWMSQHNGKAKKRRGKEEEEDRQ